MAKPVMYMPVLRIGAIDWDFIGQFSEKGCLNRKGQLCVIEYSDIEELGVVAPIIKSLIKEYQNGYKLSGLCNRLRIIKFVLGPLAWDTMYGPYCYDSW